MTRHDFGLILWDKGEATRAC